MKDMSEFDKYVQQLVICQELKRWFVSIINSLVVCHTENLTYNSKICEKDDMLMSNLMKSEVGHILLCSLLNPLSVGIQIWKSYPSFLNATLLAMQSQYLLTAVLSDLAICNTSRKQCMFLRFMHPDTVPTCFLIKVEMNYVSSWHVYWQKCKYRVCYSGYK